MGKPTTSGGLGWGAGPVALVLTLVIFGLVAYLAITRADVQAVQRDRRLAALARPYRRTLEPAPEALDRSRSPQP